MSHIKCRSLCTAEGGASVCKMPLKARVSCPRCLCVRRRAYEAKGARKVEGDKWGQMEAKGMDPDGSARHMDPRKQDTTNNEKEVSGRDGRMDPEA